MNISWPRCVSFPLEERVLKRLRLLSWWKCSAEWIKIVVLKMCLVLPCVEADRVVYPFCLWVVKVQIHIKDLSSRMSPTLEGVEIPSWKHKNSIFCQKWIQAWIWCFCQSYHVKRCWAVDFRWKQNGKFTVTRWNQPAATAAALIWSPKPANAHPTALL